MHAYSFPAGLINPLLSGFPGFPGSAAGSSNLPFPNPLQQFLGAAVAPKSPEPSPAAKEEEEEEGEVGKKKLTKKKKKKKRFKCSKCQAKFKLRQSCLRHIHKEHQRQQPQPPQRQFSPVKRHANRAEYVRQLMALLRVPTSRARPAEPSSPERKSNSGNHIMQPFLLKAPKDNFVPSLVYLPVAKRISQPMTVAFSLTPA